jgi:branched-chain amino acid transport system permease protein/urea transport system permease protein
MVAFGLAVVFGLMGVINLAHGEFLMLGAYGAVFTTQVLGSFWLALLVSPLLVACIGVVVERGLVRRLYQRPLDTIVATFGLAIILRELVRYFAGSDFKSVADPLDGAVSVLGADFSAYRLVVIGIVLVVLAAMFLVQRNTRGGLVAKAVIKNPELAASMGIDIKVVYRNTFALGAALAAVAGVLVAPTVNVYPDMGIVFVIPAFLAVLVGSVGSLSGLTVAVFGLATLQYVTAQVSSPLMGIIALLLVSIAALRFMPDGIAEIGWLRLRRGWREARAS